MHSQHLRALSDTTNQFGTVLNEVRHSIMTYAQQLLLRVQSGVYRTPSHTLLAVTEIVLLSHRVRHCNPMDAATQFMCSTGWVISHGLFSYRTPSAKEIDRTGCATKQPYGTQQENAKRPFTVCCFGVPILSRKPSPLSTALQRCCPNNLCSPGRDCLAWRASSNQLLISSSVGVFK